MRRTLALISLLLCLIGTTSAFAQAEPDVFEGELTADQPTASFEITLQAGDVVTLTTESDDSLDTVLTLTDASGATAAENDDAGNGLLTSRIVYIAQDAGTYTATVRAFDDISTGTFRLVVQVGADFGLSSEATTLVEERGTITAGASEAKYKIDVAAGDVVVITTLALTPDLDTTLTLTDAGGTKLATNDDRGDGTLNSQIIYEAATAGELLVLVSSYGGSTGDYLISIALDPNAQAPFNFLAIDGPILSEFSGSLDEATPAAAFEVALTEGQTMLATTTRLSGNLDTVLTLLDPDGRTVATNDDRGDGTLNSAIAYTVPSSGLYQLEVKRFPTSDNSGEFSLRVQEVDSSVVATLNALLENVVTLSGETQVLLTPNFRVQYTLEGADATTADYAQSVADTLEEIYDVQVNQIGWAEPIRGTDGLYLAFIADTIGVGDGALGYAKSIVSGLDNPNTPDLESNAARAVFVVDNDFANLESEASAQSLMRATVTHEFNHIIQYGYDSEEGLDWLYESTASWTETVTVGNDQDATGYVETDFTYPELCFASVEQSGLDYGGWTFLESLADQYGESFIVSIWANGVTSDGFATLEGPLAEEGATLPEAILHWRAQNFARDYDLGPLFGRTVWLENTISDEGEWTFSGQGIQQLAANYFALDLNGSYDIAVDGPASLELWGLGVADGQVAVIPLGREGTFDTSAYDYAALMVFNPDMPDVPGECEYVDYTLKVEAGTGTTPEPAFTFSAENFEPLG